MKQKQFGEVKTIELGKSVTSKLSIHPEKFLEFG